MRWLFLVVLTALTFAAAGSAGSWNPSASWFAQANCVHAFEGPWTANTGNGHFGGMQFSAETWLNMKGKPMAAFKHPGNPAFPFTASPTEQLHRAWLLWLHEGRSWRSWGVVGAACSQAAARKP